ncbi:helix-turn-helix domain-containing protein [Sphingomonas sp. TX0522]|jgi:excisionase family DNA binding protein|uniref:helix-turn-helix domain-containing protein n=1 Tax=Sphingomonas sp. TX0522 TaxID=2479205 RepID=UPI001E2C7262|nr:helix-turn-helix domain-containing protein [Sphingomonas sp. TX0522]
MAEIHVPSWTQMHPLTFNRTKFIFLVVNASNRRKTVTMLGDDLLKGAKRIGTFLNLGEREIYVLAARGELPTFKLGKHLCVRKSQLDEWLRFRPPE